MTTVTAFPVQGRWGFYPCSYELYRQLKRLNFLATEARRRAAAWRRWHRKLPHNRVVRRYVGGGPGSRGKKETIGPLPEPLVANLSTAQMDLIGSEYRKARYPADNAAQVKPPLLSDAAITELLVELEAWYAAVAQPASGAA